MNKTIPHELNPLPVNIGRQLSELEARHKAHQAMLEDHRERKHQARERHKAHWHRINLPPIVLI